MTKIEPGNARISYREPPALTVGTCALSVIEYKKEPKKNYKDECALENTTDVKHRKRNSRSFYLR